MPTPQDLISAAGMANRAGNFLGVETIPPAMQQAFGMLTGIANPYAFLASKGYDLLKQQATKQLPFEMQQQGAGNQAASQEYAGMMRNELRDILPESVAAQIPQHQPQIYTPEQMGIEFNPQAFQAPQENYQSQDFSFTPSQMYDVPDLGNTSFDMPSFEPTYSAGGEDYGQFFNQGGIASLRRKA